MLNFNDILSSTQGNLFFGVPQNVEKAFGDLGEMALEEETFSDSAIIKALKQDIRWLQATNLRYSKISDGPKMTYFIESAGDDATRMPAQVCQRRIWTVYITEQI